MGCPNKDCNIYFSQMPEDRYKSDDCYDCGKTDNLIEAQEPESILSNSTDGLCACLNIKCPNNDKSESGCKIKSIHTIDMCKAFYVQKAAARIAELEEALAKIDNISWGYDGDCGAQVIVDSVLST